MSTQSPVLGLGTCWIGERRGDVTGVDATGCGSLVNVIVTDPARPSTPLALSTAAPPAPAVASPGEVMSRENTTDDVVTGSA